MTRRKAVSAARSVKLKSDNEIPPLTGLPLSKEELVESSLRVLPDLDKTKFKGNFAQLYNLAQLLYAQKHVDLAANALSWAYVQKDGFISFSRDIVGYADLDPGFHRKMATFVTGGGEYDHPMRMLLAFRGSFKSSLTSMSYPAWRIAQSFMENGGTVPLRIGLASERMPLASAHCRGVRGILQSPRFIKRFLDHRPTGKMDWSSTSLTSAFQPDMGLKDPTVFTIALGAERTGFHFNLIIPDDIQAYASAFSTEQLDKAWELYSLLHSLLDPNGEIVMAGTRWHYDDIYARIIETGKKRTDNIKHFATLTLPAEVDGEPVWPARFPREVLDEKRIHSGSFVYSCQYLLDPIPEGARRFSPKDMRYRTVEITEQLEKRNHWYVMGVDPAWVSEDRIRAGDASSKAHSVVCTMGMDAGWNWYLMDIFREQCGRRELIDEIFRQFKEWKPMGIGVQLVDKKYLAEEFDRKSFETKLTLPWYWLSHYNEEGSVDKKKRIEGALEGLVRSHKLYLMRGLEWLESEFYQFPRSSTLDGLDAIVNAIKTAPYAPRDYAEAPTIVPWSSKHIDDLLSGKLGKRRRKRWQNAY